MASSIIGRKVFPAAAAALTANVASGNGFSSILDGKSDGDWMNTTSRAVCEAVRSDRANGKGNKSNENRFLFGGSGVREAVLRKRVSPVLVFNSFDV